MSKAKFSKADGTKNWDAIAKAIDTTDKRAISYFKTMDDGKGTIDNSSASVEGMSEYLKKSGQSFDFAAVKATLFNTALNAGIFLVATLAIQGIANTIDDHVHSAEKAIELTEELKSKHEDANKEYESHKELVDNLTESYERLSKGVDTATNKNIDLSSEEYEEYLDITNQLAEAFPSLYKTLDDNGNAILTLGANSQSAAKDLEDLLKAEENLNNYKIAQDIDGLFGGVKVKIDEANQALEEYQASSAELEENYARLKDISENESSLSSDTTTSFVTDLSTEGGVEYYNALSKAVQNFREELIKTVSSDDENFYALTSAFDLGNVVRQKDEGIFEFYLDTTLLSPEQLESLRLEIKEQTEGVMLTIQDEMSTALDAKNLKQQEADLAWKDFIPQLVAGMKSKGSFKSLAEDEYGKEIDEFGEDIQALAIDMVSGLDSSVREQMGDDPYGWVRNNIILPLSQLDKSDREKVSQAYNALLKLNPDDLTKSNQDAINELIISIATLLGKDESEIRVNLGFEIDEDAKAKYDSLVDKFGQEAVDSLSPEDLTYAYQIKNVGDMSFEELQAEIQKLKDEAENGNETTISSITSSIQQIATQLEPQFAKLGEAYKAIFTTDGFTLKDVDNSMLEELRSSFAEIEEEVGVTFDSKQLESFFATLTKGDSTAKQVQQAFNDLATSYLYSTDTLSNLNEETAEAIEKQLEELGVANAHEVVYDTLNAKTEALALQKQYLAQTGNELISVTSAEAIGFLNEAGASETARKYLMLLTAQEQIFGNSDLNVTEKIADLQKLAQEYGNTALAASIAAKMEQASKSAATGGSYSFQDAFNEAKAEFQAAATTVEIDFSDIGTGSASKAGGDAGDAYVEAFEKELSELQDLRDRGVIDEKEYLDRLRLLYTRYFADRKEYLDEYNKYEHEYLTGMFDLYNSALSAITKLMGNKIDAVEEEKEATISAIEEEKESRIEAINLAKEQLEAEIDLIDEQIEAKQDIIDSIQDEIDKMREANEERKRATDLQKAQYDLERMIHQRTQLVYQGGQMVYRPDDEGIRDAREAVDDAKLEIEIAAKEKEISLIEDEIDLLEKQKDAIQDQIDALDKQADSIEKYYSKMISQQEKYYDSLIKSMEEQKSKWEELAEVQEIAEAYSAVQQVFRELGYTVEDVLNGSSGAFEDFKEKYINLMSDLNSNSSFTDGLSYATGVAKDDLGSFLEKTQEVGQGLDDLSAKGEGLNAVSGAMDSANTSASGLKTSTDGLNDNLSGISDSLTSIPSSEGINGWVTGFTDLGEAIKGVSQALGIGEEGTVGSLVSALKDISEVTLGTEEEGIIGQFGLLKKAVDDVSSAISGGASSGNESGDASNSKSPSMSAGATEGGAGGLVGAIEDIGTTTTDTLGESSEEGGTGVIGKFAELKNAVDLVTQSIGTGEEEEGEEATTLIGALQAQFDKAEKVLPEEKTLFDELLSSIQACVSALVEMATAIETMPAIGTGGGIPIPTPLAEGTVGHAFANGTGKYKGLSHDEKLAVRSEYGQPELTVYPDGKAELTTKPTVSSLPKDTVVFNEEQTKKALSNEGQSVGKALANGTIANPDGSFTTASGITYTPLREGAVYELLKKIEENQITFDESMVTPMHSIRDQVQEMVNGVNNSYNTNNNRQQVNIGDIHVTCTGVTSQEVAKQVGDMLHKEFGGMALEALQETHITR